MKKIILTIAIILAKISICAQISGVANDCADAIPICSNETYNAGSTVNQGDDCDVNTTNRGCITGDPYPTGSPQEIFCRHEYSPAFLYFKIETSGTLEFLAYNSGTDLDWMLYGPCIGSDLTAYCSYMRSNAPIRCNFAAAPGQATGCTGTGAGQTREPSVNVTTGDVYILLIQQWGFPPSTLGFDLYFNGGSGGNRATTTATFDCGILPVEFGDFYGRNIGSDIKIKWTTTLEQAINEFVLIRFDENGNKNEIARFPANGLPSSYEYTDKNLRRGHYMYQIKTIEQDGSENFSKIVTVQQNFGIDNPELIKICNVLGQELDKNNLPKNEVLIFIYQGGISKKVTFIQN